MNGENEEFGFLEPSSLLEGRLESLLDGSAPAGFYRFAGRVGSDELLREAARRGWWSARLNGNNICDKSSFLDAMARAFAFPGYVARNWDAFEESITDLAWAAAPGYLLIYDAPYHFAASYPKEWQTACAILGDAIGYWTSKGKPFHLLLRQTHGAAPDAPLLR